MSDAGTHQRHARAACSQRIREDERFVLATHENPDGDALGSLVAMQGLLSALGKDSAMFISPADLPLPERVQLVPAGGPDPASRRRTSPSAPSCSSTAATSTATPRASCATARTC